MKNLNYTFVTIVSGLVIGSLTAFAAGSMAPGAHAADETYVSNYSANKITVFARTASGDVLPTRTIQTGLNQPHTLGVDLTNHELFVPNNLEDTHAPAINVYDLGASFPGNDSPKRTISGALTLLNRPAGLVVDALHQELYVANDLDAASSAVLVFPLGATGNVAPTRIIQGPLTTIVGPLGMALDLVHDELIVVNYKTAFGGSITVFHRTATGNVAPIRTIQGALTEFSSPQGVALDLAHDELLVANSRFSTALPGDVLVFPRSASGDTAPVRQITGPSTGLCNPIGLVLDAVNDELVVANSGFASTQCTPSVTTYARAASGDAAPIRKLGPGPLSALSNPESVLVTTGTADCAQAANGTPCDDGNACTQTDTCQAGACVGGNPVTCPIFDGCHQVGVCNPTSGICSNPSISCDDGNACTADGCNPAIGCVHSQISCDDGNACTADSCNPATGCVHPRISCDDGNLCTADSCNPSTGCVHTGVDGPDNSCAKVTDGSYCELPTGLCGTSATTPEFQLIDLQQPTSSVPQGTIVLNDYIVNASNPGQFAYTVVHAASPGAFVSLTIRVPYPFVTQGSNPIQVYGTAQSSGSCFVPSSSVRGLRITTAGGHLSPSRSPVILRSDYGVQNLGATTTVNVTGTVPRSGIVYVTLHLDYDFKRITGWQQAPDGTTLQGPDTNLDNTLDGLGSGPIYVASPQSYRFSFSAGSATHAATPSSCNSFKQKH